MEGREDISALRISQDSHSETTKGIVEQRVARLGDRLIALIIDSLFIAASFAVIGMWGASQWGGITETGFSMEGKPAWVAIFGTLLFAFVYYWIMEGLFGATLGKVIIGIQVIKKDRTRCGMRASLIRNLLRVIDGLGVYLVGFLIAIFSKMRQRLGDHLAGTIIIEKKFHMALRAFSVILWLGGIAGGILLAYDIHRGIPKPIASPPSAPARAITPSVEVAGDLKIVNFKFVQSKDGPVRPETPYKPGDKVYTVYNVTGFTTDQEGKTHLLLTVTAFDPDGILLYPPYQHEFRKAVSRPNEPVDGYFNFDLPLYAPSGKYNIQIKAQDLVKNTECKHIQPFNIEGVPTKPFTHLEFRDFQFSLSEDGSSVTKPVIRSGGTIYSSCLVGGMKFREDRIDVLIGIRVIGPRGETVFEKPEFIKLNDPYFYRPATFFQKITAHVSLPSNASNGKYTWKYTMTDRIANKKIDYDTNFEVK